MVGVLVGCEVCVAAMAACTVDPKSGVEVGVWVGVDVGTAVDVGVVVGVSVGVGDGTAVGVEVGVSVGVEVGVLVGVEVGVSVGVDVGGSGVAVTSTTCSVDVAAVVGVRVSAGVGEGEDVEVAFSWATRVAARAVCVARIASFSNSVVVKSRVPITANAIRATTNIPPTPRIRGEIDSLLPVVVGTVCAVLFAEDSVTRSVTGVGVRSRPGTTDTSLTRGAGAIVVIGIAAIV